MKRGQVKKGTQEYIQRGWYASQRHDPWSERLRRLLVWIGPSGKRHNVRTHHVTQWMKDETRAIREGYLVVSRRRFWTVKMLELTERGRSYLAGPPTAPQPQPYAKRRAGMAEFYAANSGAPTPEVR